MICPLHFVRPGAKYPSCGSASALPPPSLGVSSLDLGRWRASGLFFDSIRGCCRSSLPWDRGRLARTKSGRWGHASGGRDARGPRVGRARRKPCGTRIAASVIWLLSFVQCGGICCGAATPSLPLPVVGVSSLDLGRWRCWWPFFFEDLSCRLRRNHDMNRALFGSRPIGMQFL